MLNLGTATAPSRALFKSSRKAASSNLTGSIYFSFRWSSVLILHCDIPNTIYVYALYIPFKI